MREDTFPGGATFNVQRQEGLHVDSAALDLVPRTVTVTVLQEQIGYAQTAARTENEVIQASADSFGMYGGIPFVCECADRSCSHVVKLTFEEYDAIRTSLRRFFNVSGHERSAVEAAAERVLLVAGELTVVEKIGIAGDIAAQAYSPSSG